MARGRAALLLGLAGLAGLAALSGTASDVPRTPPGLPGLPPPFTPTAAVGSGGATAGIDAYGDVTDLRFRPAGGAAFAVPLERQRAGTVPAASGIVPRAVLAPDRELPLWRASSVTQGYLPDTNVLRTSARFGGRRFEVLCAAAGERLACLGRGPHGARPPISFGGPDAGAAGVLLGPGAHIVIRRAARRDRRWLSAARPLGPGAPPWARRLYRRSLLVLRALGGSNGAVAAGARDGWAHVWPRDAAAAAIALAASGYRQQARRIAAFLLGLDLGAAARFDAAARAIPGRDAQGDATGWVAAAARAAGEPGRPAALPWRDRADYQEGDPGDYLGNAIAARSLSPDRAGADPLAAFSAGGGLVRAEGGPSSGLDTAAAWAVRPFGLRPLYPAARRTLLRLARGAGRFGLVPSLGWRGGSEPWSAPTAWTAWGLAALGQRRPALRLLGALRRAATPAELLPERVDPESGVPRSTTPLAWSHAFAILALRALWPSDGRFAGGGARRQAR